MNGTDFILSCLQILPLNKCWAMKTTDEKRLHVAEMRMLRWMCGMTRIDKVRNEHIKECLKMAQVT